MKLAADLSRLWADLPYLDRFDAACEAGFDGVVVPFPYDMPAKDTQRAILRSGLTLVSIAAPPPNYTGGVRGFAATVGGEHRFQYDLRRALRYCDALGVTSLRVIAGPGQGDEALETLTQNLRTAASMAPENVTITLGVETGDGAVLNTLDAVVHMIEIIGSDRIGFAMPSDRLDAAETVLSDHLARVTNVQLVGQSGPDVHAVSIRDILAKRGYAGWVTAAYDPGMPTENTLGWLAQWRS